MPQLQVFATAFVLASLLAAEQCVATEQYCCVQVDTSTRQLVDAQGEARHSRRLLHYDTLAIWLAGRARLFHGVNVVGFCTRVVYMDTLNSPTTHAHTHTHTHTQVYKSFPYHPHNSTFDPEFSLSKEDVEFLVESGFTVVRLYVAWPGVEPEEGLYNVTYLEVGFLSVLDNAVF